MKNTIFQNMIKYNREDVSKDLLRKCQVCMHGGKDVFPDCVDFDPTKNCSYFNNVNDCNNYVV